jgi:hypothetical protein
MFNVSDKTTAFVIFNFQKKENPSKLRLQPIVRGGLGLISLSFDWLQQLYEKQKSNHTTLSISKQYPLENTYSINVTGVGLTILRVSIGAIKLNDNPTGKTFDTLFIKLAGVNSASPSSR